MRVSDGWAAFWEWANTSELGVTIVGGLIVAAVAGLVALIPKLRRPAISWLRRAWSFARSIRVTTTARLSSFERNALEKARRTAEVEMADKRTLRELLMEQASQRSVESQESAVAPPAKSVWSFSEGRSLMVTRPNSRLFKLTNHAEGVEALDVRVEADNTRIGFPGGAYWASILGGVTKEFSGDPTGVSGEGPLVYTIRWREGGYEFSKQIVPTSRII